MNIKYIHCTGSNTDRYYSFLHLNKISVYTEWYMIPSRWRLRWNINNKPTFEWFHFLKNMGQYSSMFSHGSLWEKWVFLPYGKHVDITPVAINAMNIFTKCPLFSWTKAFETDISQVLHTERAGMWSTLEAQYMIETQLSLTQPCLWITFHFYFPEWKFIKSI